MKDVSFEGLEKELMQKTIDDKAERYLSLIQDLKSRKLGVLKSIDAGLRNNIDYMLPLLYAYKNQPDGNFDVFSYCGPVIQENPDIADEVVRFQPELIKDTIWMSDPDFIVKHLAAVPKLRQYLSTEMLNDEKVKAEIERIDQIDPMIAVGLGTVATMGGAVGILGVAYTIDQLEDLSMIPNLEEFQKEDFQYLNQVNEEKRDDPDYLKELVSRNFHAFEYIAEHADDFGLEGLDSVKEQVEKDAIEKARKKFEEEKKQKEEELAQNPEDKEAKKRIKQLDNHIKLMEKLQNGEEVPMRVVQKLYEVTQDEELKAALKQYMQLDEKVQEKKHDVDYVKGYVDRACDEKPSKKLEYVAEKAETFGRECLEGARDVVVKRTMEDAISDFQKEVEKLKEKSQEEGRELSPEEQKKAQQNDRHIAYIQKLVETDLVKAVRFARKVYVGCPNVAPEYKAVLSQLIRIDDVALEKAEKEKQTEKDASPVPKDGEKEETSAERPYLQKDSWKIERSSSIGTSEVKSAASHLEKVVKEQNGQEKNIHIETMEKQ